ncbi:MAG: hypothetical protein ABI554_11775 [Flavobacterium sp.]
MKTILLLMSSLFLISQNSFGKEINTMTVVNKTTVENFNATEITVKESNSSTAAAIERNRVWLNLTNAGGAFKQILVGYITGATNGWDKLYDAVTIDSNPYVDFYSINVGKNLTIQGRALPFVVSDEVPLGYKTTIDGTFVISIDHVDGFMVTQDVFLEDKTTGVFHNLKNGAYSFSTLTGRFDDRFVLLYVDNTPVPPIIPEELIVAETPQTVIVTPEVFVSNISDVKQNNILEIDAIIGDATNVPFNENIAAISKLSDVVVSVNNNQITINSRDGFISEIFVYNMGQVQLFQKQNINSDQFVISDIGETKQVLLVKTQLKNGKWIASKIIL